MKYDALYQEFKDEFPESVSFLEKQEKVNILDSGDGIHVLYAFSVVPYIKSVLKAGDAQQVEKIADFLEKMATDPDQEVNNVLQVTILESLLDDTSGVQFHDWDAYWKDETKSYLRYIRLYMDV